MKKFFKILRKIIKILLKIILWLILWIFIIITIWLVIINNRSLKFYEDENYNTKFTINKNFKVENWYEVILNLKERNIDFSENYYWKKTKWLFNLKIPNISSIKKTLKTDNKMNVIFCFIDNWYFEFYDENDKIKQRSEYSDYIETDYIYYFNWNIMEEHSEDMFWNINISTWYYENWGIEYIDNYNWNIWVETWYYNNWNIKYIRNKIILNMWEYSYNDLDWEQISYYENWQIEEIWNINNWLWIYTYYDDIWNFIWTWEISCIDEIINWYCSKKLKNGFFVEYLNQWYPKEKDDFELKISDISIKSKWNYINWQKDWYRIQYFEDGNIYSEWNYDNWKKVWTRNRYLWDWSIWISKNYDE